MRDPSSEPFTLAETRLAARLYRWSDHGVVATDATTIATRAATAARAGRIGQARSWPGVGSRRTLLAMAALLLLAAGLALAAAATILRPSPQDAYRAVVVRQVDGGVEARLVDADGSERLLRRLTVADLGLDPRYVLGGGGGVSQKGWLELFAGPDGEDRTGLARWGLRVLVDLADPGRAPIILPSPGFTGGRWGPDGRYALFCTDSTEPPNCGQPMGPQPHEDAGAVRVFDPDLSLASEVIVPEVQTFGGGPEIVWTADGSGFLARQGTRWGVTLIDGGGFVPGAPKVLSRSSDPARPDLEDPGGWAVPGGDSGLAPAIPVGAQLAADGEVIWQLLEDPAGPLPRVLLARLTGPGVVESVRTVELPEGPATWFELSPDDTFVAIHIGGTHNVESFVLAPVTAGDTTVTAGPVIEGSLAGLVPAASADGWPGR